MLQKLQIQNYAIIENLEINFSDKLNIITGETGAGKSILMGALNLILGQRADTAVLNDKTKKSIVEGYFNLPIQAELKSFFEQHELDEDAQIILRREIAPTGKSRSFVNDTPVNLAQLKQLAVLLVDLHQQFDTLELGNTSFQRQVLDAMADNNSLLAQLKEKFTQLTLQRKKLEALHNNQISTQKELDYNQFLFDELKELSLKENELEDLEVELKLLSNAENIKQEIAAVYFELKESDTALIAQLKQIQQSLHQVKALQKDLPALYERLGSTVIEIDDIASEIETVGNHINYDSERIQVVTDRMDAGYKLYKKHQVSSTHQLISIANELEQKIVAVQDGSLQMEKLTKLCFDLQKEAEVLAKEISERRKKQAPVLTTKVNALLKQIGMPNARLAVEISNANLSANGFDEIVFLFDANNSNRFEPLHKVASGGELSRLMLSIKSLVAEKLNLPTLIFDEIDTGISGEAAKQVGKIMQALAVRHQLIVISHQPQIAAKANAHFFVYKQKQGVKISTAIKLLKEEERIAAIAQMMAGENPTQAALQNAKEMLAG